MTNIGHERRSRLKDAKVYYFRLKAQLSSVVNANLSNYCFPNLIIYVGNSVGIELLFIYKNCVTSFANIAPDIFTIVNSNSYNTIHAYFPLGWAEITSFHMLQF